MDQIQLLTLWITFLAASALLIRVGQALAAVGSARSKSAASAIARNLCDLAVVILAFSLLGMRLMTWATPARLIGNEPYFGIDFRALTLHFTVMASISSALIAPAVAGRSRLLVPLIGSLFISLLLFPLLGYWVWYGWLHRAGFIDIAGAIPLHLAGALCALVAVYFVGPRTGKYNRDGSTAIIPAHQPAFSGIGILIMLAGWLPYVMGNSLLWAFDHGMADLAAAAAGAAINALVAAAAGAIGAVLIVRWRSSSRDDLTALCGGLLAGAVSMTAACGTIAPWQAAALGLIAGLLTPVISQWLDFKCRIDDPGAMLAPHGVGAIVASLGVAVFSQHDLTGALHSCGIQCLGIGVTAVSTILFSWILFALLGRFMKLRVSESDEFDGLDLSQHDVNAYPDFQQTTIKSYHLREA